MARITELLSVQIPLVTYAKDADWTIVPPDTSVSKRRGEAGVFHYPDLEAALLRLNPNVVTSDNVQGVIQQLEALPNTMEGNRETLEWLRGARTVFVQAEKRRRNVTLIDFADINNNVFQV